MTESFDGAIKERAITWEKSKVSSADDWVAEERAVALVYNGVSHVVMMASPRDLEEFALGFSLSEGILRQRSEWLDFEEVETQLGIELRITISSERFVRLKEQRRNLTGRTGCGLCGAESLEQALPVVNPVNSELTISHVAVQKAIEGLQQYQRLQQLTGAVHAAAWCNLHGDIALLREDVGRHNALDKLLGARQLQGGEAPGFIVVTSRASYEMVTKTARANVAVLVAVSAATTLAIEYAQRAGLTLVGFARPGRHVVYSGSQRLTEE